jgi:hypothetical protein
MERVMGMVPQFRPLTIHVPKMKIFLQILAFTSLREMDLLCSVDQQALPAASFNLVYGYGRNLVFRPLYQP